MGVTRIPPSTEEVAEAVRRHHQARHVLSSLPVHLADAMQVRTAVQAAFRTTPARAREWIERAVTEGSLVRVYSSEHGNPSVYFVDEKGKGWRGSLEEAGYGDPDTNWHFRLTRHGSFLAQADAPYPGPWAERSFITTPDVLREFIAMAEKARDDWRVGRAAKEIVDGAAIQHAHADAVDILRGLLATAGVSPRDGRNGGEVSPLVMEEGISVTINLAGDAIDKVAETLRAAGFAAP